MSAVTSVRANRQLAALIALRWRMIRSRRIQLAIASAALIPPVLVVIGLVALQQTPDDQRFNLGVAAPTFYLGFAILTMLAPLVSGGGYELFPSGQLVAYPIKPATAFRSTLLLAPINLAWMLNVIALFVVTGFAAGDPALIPTARSLLVVAVFVGAATILGHGVGWLVMGIRQRRSGRIVTNVLGLAAVLAAFALVRTGYVVPILDRSPTTHVMLGAFAGYQGRWERWLVTIAILSLIGLAMIRFGDWAAGWALRRPGEHADRTSSRALTRRSTKASALSAILAIDHASVWRSTPLRRGVLVIVIVPGVIGAMAGMSWQSLVLVPGLIAAGAGLLFGINAFTLDSTGSVWLSTMPGWSDPAFLAKSLVYFEVALAAVTSALLGGSLRAPTPTSAADVTAAVTSAVSCALIVVALGMRSSLKHPHRAELQGPRDTPATPGVMAAQSIRFACITTMTSLVFAGLALTGVWWLPLVAAIPVAAMSALHWLETRRAWQHPHVRAFVVATVAGG